MPLPLLIVPIAIGASALAGVAAKQAPKVVQKFQTKKLAILGREGAGKTELLAALCENDANEPKGQQPKSGSGYYFALHTPGPRRKSFVVAQDLLGSGGSGRKHWKSSFDSSDHVWYVFRSDLLVAGDEETTRQVDEDLDYLADWLDARRDAKKKLPRVILIGLFADKRAGGVEEAEFVNSVQRFPMLRLPSVKLDNADIVAGDLATPDSARELVNRIADCFQS